MNELPVVTPVGPQSVRVFCGYRLPSLTPEAFYKELSETFMPGTPFMLAPLGLSAYVPAVIDLDPAEEMPDEVAIIVYASVEAYTAARRNSLQGRMYTHSHAGVFDMSKSRGQFPGPTTAPDKLQPDDRWAWYLFDERVDWQIGSTRVMFLQGDLTTGSLQQMLVDKTASLKRELVAAGVDQLIAVAGANYAALWFHGPARLDIYAGMLGLPAEIRMVRDLLATPVPMRTGTEGVNIQGTGAYTFRFVRDLHYFL